MVKPPPYGEGFFPALCGTIETRGIRIYPFLNGPLQRLRAYVQLVPLLSFPLPNLRHGDVSVGPWGRLNGNNWFFQLPAEPVRIDRPENLLQVARCPAGLDGFFHGLFSFHLSHPPAPLSISFLDLSLSCYVIGRICFFRSV